MARRAPDRRLWVNRHWVKAEPYRPVGRWAAGGGTAAEAEREWRAARRIAAFG